MDPEAQVRQMRRGVNIIGYDPIWENFGKRRFKQVYFKRLADAGFSTVRVNLQAFNHMDAMNRLDPTWLKTLDWVVDNATASGLTVILDEHDFTVCGEQAALCHTKLMAFWQQVAPRYKDEPNNVIFEILNEPNQAITAAGWNTLLSDALSIIRVSNPERNVVIGPAMWNSGSMLDRLLLPATDRHIIVTIHYYSPMKFTHQGASWAKAYSQLSGVTWGTDEDKQAVVNDFDAVEKWSEASGRPILLGEFGAYDKGEMDSRARYTAFVARTAESHGWAWTYWQFDSNFILYDVDKDQWVGPIKDALVPGQ